MWLLPLTDPGDYVLHSDSIKQAVSCSKVPYWDVMWCDTRHSFCLLLCRVVIRYWFEKAESARHEYIHGVNRPRVKGQTAVAACNNVTCGWNFCLQNLVWQIFITNSVQMSKSYLKKKKSKTNNGNEKVADAGFFHSYKHVRKVADRVDST